MLLNLSPVSMATRNVNMFEEILNHYWKACLILFFLSPYLKSFDGNAIETLSVWT